MYLRCNNARGRKQGFDVFRASGIFFDALKVLGGHVLYVCGLETGNEHSHPQVA